MEKTSETLHNLYTNTHTYINLQARSVKLEIYERITNIVSSGISVSIIVMFGLFSFLFINFGLAYFLSDLFQSRTYGFLAVGGFYVVVLGIYLLLKNKASNNKLKNTILLKVSKTMNDYDAMLKEQTVIHAQVSESEAVLKENFDELKQKIDVLKADIDKFKGNFSVDENATVGPKVPRILMTGAVDFIMKNFVLKNSGFIVRNILPVVANTFLTSKVFHEEKKTSLLENLKLKISKFL